jgi:hypothetical protein
MLKENKKGFAIFSVIAFISIALLVIYMVLYLPIPSFTAIRGMINYFIIIIFWVILQVALVYGYYKLGVLVAKGVNFYRSKIYLWVINIKNFMLARR